MSTESKEHVLKRLDEAWPAFQALLDTIPDAEYDTAGVTDEWCLKELLGHVIFWADKGAHDVRVAAGDKTSEIKVPEGDVNVDAWNADAAAKGKAMSIADLKAGSASAHEAARRAVAESPEEPLAIKLKGWTVGRRFAEDTYRHYEEHAEQIKNWMKGLETSEA